MKALPLFAFIALASTAAAAHDKWWNGKEVDPSTKRYCCGDNDIKHLTREEVKIVPGGYQLFDTGEVVTQDHAQPSPLGRPGAHAVLFRAGAGHVIAARLSFACIRQGRA